MSTLRRLAVLVLVAAVAIGAGEYRQFTKTFYADITITEAGDSARSVYVTLTSGLDSFAYIDSFSYQYDTSAHKTVTYTSPPQSMALTVGSATDTTLTYACSLDCGTNVYGFTYACPETVFTVAQLIDRLVESINTTWPA